MSPRCCSVVGSIACDVPAHVTRGAIRNRASLLASCYICGEPVCRQPGCSELRYRMTLTRAGHRRREVRVCGNCAQHEPPEQATISPGTIVRIQRTRCDQMFVGRIGTVVDVHTDGYRVEVHFGDGGRAWAFGLNDADVEVIQTYAD